MADAERKIPLLDDEGANPYNANKDWHDDSGESISDSADNLYVPKRKARKPEPETVESATSEDDNTDNHDYKKRWSDLKKLRDRELKEWREELAELKAKVESKETTDKPETASTPETNEELTAWIEKNPDLFKMVKTVAQQETVEGTQDVKQQLEEINKEKAKLARETARAEVLKAHNDFDEITKADEFHDWAESQPDVIQSMIYDNPSDYRSLIRAIDLYKADTGLVSKEVESSDAAKPVDDGADTLVSTRVSGDPSTSGKKVWSRQEISKMSMDEFDRLEEEINLAIFEGRITD